MGFSHEQIESLKAPLDKSKVATRTQAGRQLSYIEGWWAIAEANRIFGFDGWLRETVDLRCVSEREREIGRDKRPGWAVSYIAKVKITILPDEGLEPIVREGVGSGHGIDADLGQAHESAVKEAETDAMKRALMTFGWPFGLALYDKSQEHVADGNGRTAAPAAQEPDKVAYVRECLEIIVGATDAKALREWWNSEKNARIRYRFSQADVDELKRPFTAKLTELESASEGVVTADHLADMVEG